MNDVAVLPLSLPARWVLCRAHAYRRAIDARGLADVVRGLRWRMMALRTLLALASLPALLVLLALAFQGVGPLGLVVLVAALAVAAVHPRAQDLGLWTGLAEVRDDTELNAIQALRDAVGPSVALPRSICQRLWMIQVLHLLVDDQGRARLATHDLAAALPTQPAAPARHRL